MRRGRKITPTVGVYPTVFGVFLRYFHPTVYIPRNFTVQFNVSLFSQSVDFCRPRILDWFGSHLPNDPKEKLQASNCNGKFCWNCQNCKLRHIQTNGKCKHFILLKSSNCYVIVHKQIVLLQLSLGVSTVESNRDRDVSIC